MEYSATKCIAAWHATACQLATRTAQNHVHHVLYKLGLHSRADLIDWAPALGLVPDEA